MNRGNEPLSGISKLVTEDINPQVPEVWIIWCIIIKPSKIILELTVSMEQPAFAYLVKKCPACMEPNGALW
jgi:hypothetical protein